MYILMCFHTFYVEQLTNWFKKKEHNIFLKLYIKIYFVLYIKLCIYKNVIFIYIKKQNLYLIFYITSQCARVKPEYN